MDKLDKQILNKSVPMRKGFALLLTLSILGIVISLSAVLIDYMSTAKRRSAYTQALIQGDMLYADMIEVLKKSKDYKKTLYKILYTTPLPFNMENGKFDVMLKCRPLANGVNINWLLYGNNSKTQLQYNTVQRVMDYLAQVYNIVDVALLDEMIVSKINGTDELETKGLFNRLENKKYIMSTKEFENIIFKYSQEVDDKSVLKIPWSKYFVFNKLYKDPKQNIIDGNYMSPELISALFGIDIAAVREDWKEGESNLNAFLNNNGVQFDKQLFSSEFYPQTQCEVYYSYMGDRFKFTFNDIENEVRDFEFYGRQ